MYFLSATQLVKLAKDTFSSSTTRKIVGVTYYITNVLAYPSLLFSLCTSTLVITRADGLEAFIVRAVLE